MKARKQGNSIVLTVPTKFGVKENQEFVAVKGEDGSITFIPKLDNIFKEAYKKGETLDVENSFPDDITVGREDI